MNTYVDHNPTPKYPGLSIRCVQDIPSGLKDLRLQEIISIYPNPATSKVSIEHGDPRHLEMKIFNMAGECILQDMLYSQSAEIDIGSISKGIYVINISSGDWSVHKKLIKE